jgi:outer membrane biosynthesis protein TonB
VKQYLLSSVLLILLVVFVSSCASTPEQVVESVVVEDSGSEEPVAESQPDEATEGPVEVPAEEPADETAADVEIAAIPAEPEPEQEPVAESEPEPESEQTSEAPPEEVVPEPEPEPKPEPLAPPLLSHEPQRATVGEPVTVSLDQSLYDSVTFDFGDGESQSPEHTYRRFGIKTVRVEVTRQEQTAAAALRINITGTAGIKLETDTVQHDATWKPLVRATLEADGDYDAIAILQFGRELTRIDRQDSYVVPVPYEGTREFSGELFYHGKRVAEIGAVALTGLNAPPRRPSYEGAKFVMASVGEEIQFTVAAEDPNSDTLLFEVKFAPDGSVFDPDTGVFTWTPTAKQKDLFLMNFYVYDVPYNLKSRFVQRGIIVE